MWSVNNKIRDDYKLTYLLWDSRCHFVSSLSFLIHIEINKLLILQSENGSIFLIIN